MSVRTVASARTVVRAASAFSLPCPRHRNNNRRHHHNNPRRGHRKQRRHNGKPSRRRHRAWNARSVARSRLRRARNVSQRPWDLSRRYRVALSRRRTVASGRSVVIGRTAASGRIAARARSAWNGKTVANVRARGAGRGAAERSGGMGGPSRPAGTPGDLEARDGWAGARPGGWGVWGALLGPPSKQARARTAGRRSAPVRPRSPGRPAEWGCRETGTTCPCTSARCDPSS